MYICDPHRLLQIFGFNGVSSTAEGSVIGSEAERKRMLIWGGGGRGGAYWTPAGDSIEERASNVLSGTVAGFINKTNVCLIMFDGNSVGSWRSDDRDGNENGKKSNRFSASSHDPGWPGWPGWPRLTGVTRMTPVDRADPVSEISPYLKILRRIFDVFIRKGGLARLPKSRLVGWKFCHMNTSARLPGRKSARSCGGLDSIVLHCLLYLHKHHKHCIWLQ